jgi:hypothetical protein
VRRRLDLLGRSTSIGPFLRRGKEKSPFNDWWWASERIGKRARRVYRVTPKGRRALDHGKIKVRELFGELFEKE